MIDSPLITLVGFAMTAIVGSIVLARRGNTMTWLERTGLVGLGLYLPLVLGLTLGGIPIGETAIAHSEWRSWANLIPFGTIGPQIQAGLESGLRQLIGNLLILVPLGFGLAVAWPWFRRPAPTLLVAFEVALGIELGQVVISLMVGVPYRAFDVDDLMLNTAGAIIGWLLWRVTLGLVQRQGDSLSDSPSAV